MGHDSRAGGASKLRRTTLSDFTPQPIDLGDVSSGALAGRRVLVIGLGRFGGGLGVTKWLVDEGARVTITDQADEASLAESIAALNDPSVTLRLGGHDPADLDGIELAVVNPAVNKDRSEFFGELCQRDIPWTTEMNLLLGRCRGGVVAVTGTYGKSTTCAMLAHVLETYRNDPCVEDAGYRDVHLGGNIGRSLLPDLSHIGPDDVVVLEISNAQLEDLPRIDWRPRIAMITNLSPHHLDRYNSYAEYVQTKINILGQPATTERLIAGPLDEEAERLVTQRLVETTVKRIAVASVDEPIELCIPGVHHQQNAACVLTVCAQLGLRLDAVRRALSTFRGLPHRLELVRMLDGVSYYDDAKSTSPSAVLTSLSSLDRPIVAIVGGQRKNVPLDALGASLLKSCREVICIGESGPDVARAMSGALVYDTACVVTEAEGLEEAVVLARERARPGDVVLFSSGAPSFDRYANFVERGKHFVRLVHGLE